MGLVGALDIGGTKIAAALVAETGRVERRVEVPTPAREGAAAVLAAAATALRELDGDLVAVGVGTAGVVDPASGRIRGATDALPGWAGTDLRGALAGSFGAEVVVDNDCHAHALGEHWLGAAAGSPSALVAVVGTGVGGSLLLDGRVHHGAHAVAGHIGHLPVPAAAGHPCTCGGRGHAEAVAAGPAMVAEYRARSGATPEEVPDLREVAARAAAGDPTALAVLTAGATALGQALGGLTNAIDPATVLVGGGVAGCGPVWWAAVEEAWSAELLPAVRGRTRLTPAALGSDAALIGAAALAWRAVRGEAGRSAAARSEVPA